MSIVIVAAFGIVGSLLSIVVKRAGNEYGFCVSVFCSTAILIYIIPTVKELIASLTSYSLPAEAESGFSYLFKAVGVGYIAQIASDICDDSGQGTIASNVRLAGKLSVIFLTFPVIKELFETVSDVL